MRSSFLVPLALATLIAAASNSTPVVDLGYAQYQGTFDASSNVSYFLGLRYAQPPTGEYLGRGLSYPSWTHSRGVPGELRWRAPQTPTTTAGVQQATEQPNECYQADDGTSSTNPYRTTQSIEKRAVSEDEDCLFLKCTAQVLSVLGHRLMGFQRIYPGSIEPRC